MMNLTLFNNVMPLRGRRTPTENSLSACVLFLARGQLSLLGDLTMYQWQD